MPCLIMLRNSIFPSVVLKRIMQSLVVGFAPQRDCSRDSRPVVTFNDSEVLDDFIDSLMTNKMKKWKSWNDIKCKNDLEVTPSNREPCTFDSSSVDNYIRKHIYSPNLESVLRVCCIKKVSPSPEILIKAAYVLAKAGSKTGIETIVSLAELDDRWDGRKKEELTVFKAEAMWRGGGSIQKSLEILHDTYKNQPSLRRFVHSSLRSLIGEVMHSRGEASLVQVKNLVLELADPPHEDAVPLSYLWGGCILSDWFADQQISEELTQLMKDKPKFKKALHNRLGALVGLALSRHQVDAVYRVLEALLKLSMFDQAQTVLGNLFDYKYVMGDKRGCESILEMCAITNLDIGSTRRKQFVNAPAVWVNRRNTVTRHKSSAKSLGSTEIPRVPKFKLKM